MSQSEFTHLPITRRDMARFSLFGAAGLLLNNRLAIPAQAATQASNSKAKSVIQIWMWGGPAHIDTPNQNGTIITTQHLADRITLFHANMLALERGLEVDIRSATYPLSLDDGCS